MSQTRPCWVAAAWMAPFTERLASCYRRCVEVAADNGVKTIAFPSISTGIFGYPVDWAAQIAIATVRTAAPASALQEIIFCCFSPSDLKVYERALGEAAI